jgi:UDP-glucose 4-epimerase
MKNNTRLLISGGAGYIGSVLSHHLKKNSIPFIILDYKKKVDPNFFPKKTILYRGDISNQILLEKIYTEFKPTHIVHLAAKISVTESEQNKAKYKLNNIIKSKIFISFFIRKKIKNFLFSSSAAVYSNSINVKKETLKEKPANYYGKTKFLIEKFLYKKKTNFGGGIELLMNEKKMDHSGPTSDIDIEDLNNLENELNDLALLVYLYQRLINKYILLLKFDVSLHTYRNLDMRYLKETLFNFCISASYIPEFNAIQDKVHEIIDESFSTVFN